MSNLTKWDPFKDLSALQKQFFGDDWLSDIKRVNIPTTDVFLKDNKLCVEAHLPNFNDEDIDIHVENGALVISAERHEKDQDKDKKYVVRESTSSFYRSVRLPDRAKTNDIDANLADGILKVTVPLEALPQPKKIKIGKKTK